MNKKIEWLKIQWYKWRCSRLKNPILPVFPHKADGTRLTELELYKLALYINSRKIKSLTAKRKKRDMSKIQKPDCFGEPTQESEECNKCSYLDQYVDKLWIKEIR